MTDPTATGPQQPQEDTEMPRRRARFRSIYVNQVPVWECGRCGTRRPSSTREHDLRAHETVCGQPTEETSR